MKLYYDHRRIELATKMLQSSDNLDRLRQEFLQKVERIVRRRFVEHWGITLELFPHALLDDRTVRVHAHVHFARKEKVELPCEESKIFGTVHCRSHGILTITQTRSFRRPRNRQADPFGACVLCFCMSALLQ